MVLLEAADVARLVNRTPATVRAWALSGVLKPAATTPRGVRLFKPEDVERAVALRRQRRPRELTSLRPPSPQHLIEEGAPL